MLKLPPYGKYLDELQKQGIKYNNSVYIFVGENSFKKAQNFQISRPTTMCLPAYDCPSLYRWPVKDCEILIFDTSFCEEDYLNDLAYYLFEAGASKIVLSTTDFKIITFNR